MKSTQAIERLRHIIRRQHKALATEDCYAFWLGRYIKALHRIPSELPSEKKLELFLTALALRSNVAASTQNQAFNPVVFFYKEGNLVDLTRTCNIISAFRLAQTEHGV